MSFFLYLCSVIHKESPYYDIRNQSSFHFNSVREELGIFGELEKHRFHSITGEFEPFLKVACGQHHPG